MSILWLFDSILSFESIFSDLYQKIMFPAFKSMLAFNLCCVP